jgi:hypothetical protein
MVRTVANTGLGGLSFLFFLLQNFYGKLGEVTMGARVVGGPEPPRTRRWLRRWVKSTSFYEVYMYVLT